MAEIYPLKEIPRSDGGCSIVEIDNDDYFAVEALPAELPNDWNEFPVGHSFIENNQAWYLGRLYVCVFSHTKTADNNPDNTGNWEYVGSHVTATSGSSGQVTVTNMNALNIRLNVNSTLNGSSVGLSSNVSGDQANYVLNLDPDDFVSSGTSIETGAGLVGNGSADNPASLDPAVRNDILLVNGFFLTAGTTVGTRTPYTGQIAGFDSATYWFDTADSSWHDAETGGNRLIGF